MCVTTAPAEMSGTMAYTYLIIDDRPANWHVTGYQNVARNLSPGPNCMLLHFPGNDLALVDGPQTTRNMMLDLTSMLPAIVPIEQTRGGAPGSFKIALYGDYDVVISEQATGMLEALNHVDELRRPVATDSLAMLLQWYEEHFPDYCFVLACFNGAVNPKHPIVVEYIPHNGAMLFVPGLDCHTGQPPIIGQQINRDFKVAFGVDGTTQPHKVHYTDSCVGKYWAPNDVTGFNDNRRSGPNDDYRLPLESANHGFRGKELLEVCF